MVAILSSMLLAHAQSVLQCVARVHEASWVHCDIKPEHFMRFPPHGAIKLVDFGSAWQCGQYVMPGHTKRYCAPELARAMLERVGLGARLSHALSRRALSRLFGVFLALVAARMLYRAFSA